MTVQFLLGGAGTGKTYQCLAGVRAELIRSVEGLPLVFLAPKQATFQIERGLLSERGLGGYTRLHILSFERLAWMLLDQTEGHPVRLLDEEGRRMVLRALVAERQSELRVFRATARLPGFAGHLSAVLCELQRQRLGPQKLLELAERRVEDRALADKLRDLALLLGCYLDWLRERGLQDPFCLLELATESLRCSRRGQPARFAGVWLDGFAELTVQELELLAELILCSDRSTLAFCLPAVPDPDPPWSSTWSAVGKTFRRVWNRLAAVPGLQVESVTLPAKGQSTRFSTSPVLGRLADGWDRPYRCDACEDPVRPEAMRLVVCEDPESEAILAAREILGYVRGGSDRRYRDVGVLLRSFEGYHDVLSRVLRRYEIPFFIDRREPVAHHPLAELTRYALRTAAFGWRQEDWFGALKSGLAPAPERAIDELENEALARGWHGTTWLNPVRLPDDPSLEQRLERIRTRVVPPFQVLANHIAAADGRVNGRQLREFLLVFWESMRVRHRLEQWATGNVDPDPGVRRQNAVHRAVWDQMRLWLDNVDRAFADCALSLNEWLPVLESGLSGLSVGVIPPALDQVMIGTIDRSRNPDLAMALVLGLNDTVFPAQPPGPGLLSEPDRDWFENQGWPMDAGWRGWTGREHYLGYIALTRARNRLVLTCAEQDGRGRVLSPSPFLARVERLLPGVKRERFAARMDSSNAEHWSELLPPAIGWRRQPGSGPDRSVLDPFLEARGWGNRIEALARYDTSTQLSAASAEALYGLVLRTSVSGLEQFAACPFRFFVHAGLRASERRLFEIDAREKGSFQHEVLARFHHRVQAEGRRWRDLTPAEARDWVGRIVTEMTHDFRDGLFGASIERVFEAERLGHLLQDYVAVAVGWMKSYGFDPVAVELGFGRRTDPLPAWELPLDDDRRLAFRGKMDRVDLAVVPGTTHGLCVVLDYKSGERKLDDLLVAHGIQIQLPAYLAVLRQLPDAGRMFGVDRLVPAGVFHVNLRGRGQAGPNRRTVLTSAPETQRLAYRHTGRFNASFLRVLDRREEATTGEQFNYRLTANGAIHASCREPMNPEAFDRMLDHVQDRLQTMGRRIYAGDVTVDPYRHRSRTACDQCDARAICRIDPWTHRFRTLQQDNTTISRDPA